MSKISIIPFKQSHLAGMELREKDLELLSPSPDLAVLSARYFEENALGFTAVAEEGYIVSAGLAKVHAGNWEAWAYTTVWLPKYGIQVTRSVGRFIKMFFASPEVNRIQAVVDGNNQPAVRWAHKLGFARESTLRKYGDQGQDFVMFAMVK